MCTRDDTGTTGARLFIALEDVLTATSGFVSVQEIAEDTLIWCQLCASSSSNPTSAVVTKGTSYDLYQMDNGTVDGANIWGVDVDSTSKPCVTIIDTDANRKPFTNATAADYDGVVVKFLSAIIA
jgi:hypothetical protein